MDGILLVDKPAGWTSHDVVAKVRSILRDGQKNMPWPRHVDAMQGAAEQRTKAYDQYSEGAAQAATPQSATSPGGASSFAGRQAGAMRRIKVGHTGTLDPFATGLLILVVGKATKRAGEFSKLDKTYQAELVLGKISTTGDPEGEITEISTHKPSEEQIKAALNKFIGQIQQVPPAFSAIKVDGQRAYKLARAGKTVELEPRDITIHSIKNIEYDYPKLSFTTEVSSGTYIRSLAEDIGKALGTGAYLSALCRLRVGDYSVGDGFLIDKLSISDIINPNL